MQSNTLLKKIAKGDTKGMINAYVCPDLHTMITVNIDNGHIPDRVACKICDQPAVSMMYQVNQNLNPVVEWFRPTQGEMDAAMLTMDNQTAKEHKEYIYSGHLIARERITIKKLDGNG